MPHARGGSVGWPESTAEQGPITEYCIEFEPLEAKRTGASPDGTHDADDAHAHAATAAHAAAADDEDDDAFSACIRATDRSAPACPRAPCAARRPLTMPL